MTNINVENVKKDALRAAARAVVANLINSKTGEEEDAIREVIATLCNGGNTPVVRDAFIKEYAAHITTECVKAVKDNCPVYAEHVLCGMLYNWSKLFQL